MVLSFQIAEFAEIMKVLEVAMATNELEADLLAESAATADESRVLPPSKARTVLSVTVETTQASSAQQASSVSLESAGPLG